MKRYLLNIVLKRQFGVCMIKCHIISGKSKMLRIGYLSTLSKQLHIGIGLKEIILLTPLTMLLFSLSVLSCRLPWQLNTFMNALPQAKAHVYTHWHTHTNLPHHLSDKKTLYCLHNTTTQVKFRCS